MRVAVAGGGRAGRRATRAADTRKRATPGERDAAASSARTAATRRRSTAASAQSEHERARRRCGSGTTQAQIVFEISLRVGNHDVSSSGRTPQLTASTRRRARPRRTRARTSAAASARGRTAGRARGTAVPARGSAARASRRRRRGSSRRRAAAKRTTTTAASSASARVTAPPEEPEPDGRRDEDRREESRPRVPTSTSLQAAERRHADAEEAVVLPLGVRVRDVAVREMERRAERGPVVRAERERRRHGAGEEPERAPADDARRSTRAARAR